MSTEPEEARQELIRVFPGGIPTDIPWQPRIGEETTGLIERLSSIPDQERAVVRDEAIAILSQCVPPGAARGQRTGLVIGYVQSGKTLSFTTVAALAHDNGFRMVIVIAGTKKDLSQQSQGRLRRDLCLNERRFRNWLHIHNPEPSDIDRISSALAEWGDEDVPSEERRTVLITVLKHWSRLQRTAETMGHIRLDGVPVLIMDDEADQAGLNNLVTQGEESTTYQWLRRLRDAVPQHTFLQYTATPQGPLLINILVSVRRSAPACLRDGDGRRVCLG